MDFGKKQLEKYGWKEGKGLGKKEDGMSRPVKPKFKFDNYGVGFNLGDEYKNNWWELMYNKAASNLSVKDNEVSAVASPKIAEDKKQNVKCDKRTEKYGSFLKTAKLTPQGLEDLDMKAEERLEASENAFLKVLTDDELFLACGGRTAHKGARHGLKQSGKLSRIEKQEKMLLKKLRNVSLSDDEYVLKKKVKKLSKHKETSQPKTENDDELDSLSSCSSSTSHKKKRKKAHRRVSFNELVTEYHNPEREASPKNVDREASEPKVPVIVEARIRDDNDNEINNQTELDEGIEQDFEDSEEHADVGHGSFEEPQAYALDKLSKKERKLLKKKRKLERKSGATAKFLEEMDLKHDWEGVSDYPPGKCKKRKLKNDVLKLDEVVSKKMHSEFEHWEKKRAEFGNGGLAHEKSKKMKKKAEKKQARQINSIVESMNQVCKISDCEQ